MLLPISKELAKDLEEWAYKTLDQAISDDLKRKRVYDEAFAPKPEPEKPE